MSGRFYEDSREICKIQKDGICVDSTYSKFMFLML